MWLTDVHQQMFADLCTRWCLILLVSTQNNVKTIKASLIKQCCNATTEAEQSNIKPFINPEIQRGFFDLGALIDFSIRFFDWMNIKGRLQMSSLVYQPLCPHLHRSLLFSDEHFSLRLSSSLSHFPPSLSRLVCLSLYLSASSCIGKSDRQGLAEGRRTTFCLSLPTCLSLLLHKWLLNTTHPVPASFTKSVIVTILLPVHGQICKWRRERHSHWEQNR